MLKYSKITKEVAAVPGIYIEYKTTDRVDAPAYWYKKQMKSRGWELKSWTPPHVIHRDLSGFTGFITLVFEKGNKRCDIGTKYHGPADTKIWIDYRE
jgi:hypothetical protein